MAIRRAMRRGWCRILWAMILVTGVPALGSAAEFVEFYKNGIAAVESNNWTLAAEMMRKAIAEQPEAKTRVKRALYFRRYLPHFYLGQALYEMGDCAGSLSAWQESESQEVVKRYPEFQQILQGRMACDQMVDLEGALAKALKAVESAEGAATQSRRRLAELPNAEANIQVLLNRQSEAEASLSRVRQRLASDDVVLDTVEEAATLAAIAKAEFEIIRQQAEELRAVRVAARQEQDVSRIDGLIKTARSELRASEYLQPYPAGVARNRWAVEQALEHAQAAADESLNVGELQAIQVELAKATRELRRSVTGPPDELKAAAEAFLARDYAGVLSILGEREFTSAKALSSSHLLRAAALFSLFYSSGARDESLLEQARQEVLACHGADGDQSPPVSLFSPSFVAFFESQTLEPVEPSDDEGLGEGP